MLSKPLPRVAGDNRAAIPPSYAASLFTQLGTWPRPAVDSDPSIDKCSGLDAGAECPA